MIDIQGWGFQFYWHCDCGRQGTPTTNGRAKAAAASHARTCDAASKRP